MEQLDQHISDKVPRSPLSSLQMVIVLFLVAILFGIPGYLIGVRIGKSIKSQLSLQSRSAMISPTPMLLPLLTPTVTFYPTLQVKIPLSSSPSSNRGQITAIVNWKTYTNQTWGYSIKYPPNQSIIDMTGNTQSTPYSVEIGIPDAPSDNYPSVYIDVIPHNGALPGTYNYDEFMKNLKQYIVSTSVGEVIKPNNEPFNIQFIRRDNMIINGNTAYVFESMIFHEERVIIQRNGMLYVIGGYSPGAQFNQVLSTFNFTTF